jgi:hypothetical protein
MKQIYVLVHPEARRRAGAAVMAAPDGYVVRLSPPTRTLEQNAAQWPVLGAIAAQLLWPVNGEMVRLTDEEFKDILTAGFRRENVRVAQGVDGGMVMLGSRTSKFKKSEFSEWLEYLHWFCAERGVNLEYEDTTA